MNKVDPFTGKALTGSRAQIMLTQLIKAFPEEQLAQTMIQPNDGKQHLTIPSRLDAGLSYLGLPLRHKSISLSQSIAAKAAAAAGK